MQADPALEELISGLCKIPRYGRISGREAEGKAGGVVQFTYYGTMLSTIVRLVIKITVYIVSATKVKFDLKELRQFAPGLMGRTTETI